MQLLTHYPPLPVSVEIKATRGQTFELTQLPYIYPV